MSNSRSARWRVAPVVAVALAAIIAGSSPAAAAVTAPEGAAAAFTVEGKVVETVSLDGTLMTLRQYDALSSAADRLGGALHLVVDRSAAERGYLVAFDDPDDASAYMVSHGMGALPSSERDYAAEAQSRLNHQGMAYAEGVSSVIAPLSVCSLPNHHAKMYDLTSCGGSYFIVLWGEEIPNLATVNWNNRWSSAGVGDCISNLTVWKDTNYSGSTTSLHGGSVYTFLPIGYNNTISSVKADVSGVCV